MRGSMQATGLVVSFVILASVSSCTDKSKEQPSPLTQRQRDSIVAESSLPGAGGVRGAMQAADSAEARNRRASDIN